jgi:hypothetical protein
MSTAKKMDLAPDEVYLQAALKEGRATVQQVSMKALGKPDTAFQARVNHLSMDHVHRLAGCYDLDGKLSPVVIFRAVEGRKTRMILADGFHRHEVHRRKGVPAIRAYVIDVAMDRIEHEAKLFATMCNQVTLLARTREDIRKAIEMLFEDQECRDWSDTKIARHCGTGHQTVASLRMSYCERNNIKIPDRVIGSNGKSMPYKTSKTTGVPAITKNPQGNLFSVVGKTYVPLGRDPKMAEEKLSRIIDSKKQKRTVVRIDGLQSFLTHRGIYAETITGQDRHLPGLGGLKGRGFILVTTTFDNADAVPTVFGRVFLLHELVGNPQARKIVVCYSEDGPQETISLARKLGVEFLNPDELLSSIKESDLDQNADPHTNLSKDD